MSWLARTQKFFGSLIKSNTGVSSKSFVLVISALLGSLFILEIMFILIVDLFTDLTIDSDLMGLTAVIGAIGSFIGAVFYFKVKSEKTEKYFDPNGDLNQGHEDS